MQNESVFVKCECSEEGVAVESWPEEEQIYLSIWSYNHKPSGLLARAKYAARMVRKVLKDGQPYMDQIVLDQKSAMDISHGIGRLVQNQVNYSAMERFSPLPPNLKTKENGDGDV